MTCIYLHKLSSSQLTENVTFHLCVVICYSNELQPLNLMAPKDKFSNALNMG